MENTYKLASHDTFTYLKPSNFLGKILKCSAQCQDKDIYKQIVDSKARMIDIRVRFDKSDEPYIAHGVVEYKTSEGFWNLFNQVAFASLYIDKEEELWCRVMFEKKNPTDKDRKLFKEFCEKLKHDYDCIKFFGGMNRYDWGDVMYDFGYGTMSDKIDEQISSVQGIGIWPWAWAKLNNKRILEEGTTKEFLMIDFL